MASVVEYERRTVEKVLRDLGGKRPKGKGAVAWTFHVNGSDVKVTGPHGTKKMIPEAHLYALGDSLEGRGVSTRRNFVQAVKAGGVNGAAKGQGTTAAPYRAPAAPPPNLSVQSSSATSKVLRLDGEHDIRVSVKTVTPTEAKAMLARHETVKGATRKLKQRNLDKLVHKLRKGQWRFNGDTITIGPDGEIVNGRHRLSAVVATEIPIQTLVVEGVPEPRLAFDVTDDMAIRSIADILQLHDFKYVKILGPALRLIYLHQHGELRKGTITGGVTGPTFTQTDAVELARRHPGLRAWVERAHECSIMPKSIFAALGYLCSRHDPEMAELFFDSLLTGEGLVRNDPVWALRRRMEKEMHLKLARRDRYAIVYLTVAAWNATRRGERMSKAVLPRGGKGERGRELPEII